jgi:hypothetical protein
MGCTARHKEEEEKGGIRRIWQCITYIEIR